MIQKPTNLRLLTLQIDSPIESNMKSPCWAVDTVDSEDIYEIPSADSVSSKDLDGDSQSQVLPQKSSLKDLDIQFTQAISAIETNLSLSEESADQELAEVHDQELLADWDKVVESSRLLLRDIAAL